MQSLALAFALTLHAQSPWPDLSAPPAASGGGENDSAVIVGVENYPFVSPIAGARKNAEEWQAYLTETLKVPSDRVTLLRDNEATVEKMRKFAGKAAREAGAGGTLWFIYIGHGAPAKDGKDGVLVGADAQQDADSLYARSLPRRELLDILAKGKQARTFALLDACFSGKGASGEALVAGLQPLIVARDLPSADPRTILLTAAKADQFAGPLPKAGEARPAFSYLALGALRGWAADAKGQVSAGAIVDFARKALALDKGRTQTPELTAGAADVVVGRGKEAAPNLAKIDREAASGGLGFKVSSLGAVPEVRAPKALEAGDAGLDFRNIDIEALKKYNAAVKVDKSAASPAEKAAAWASLVSAAPKFADVAQKRIAEWQRFAEQQKAAEEAKQARIAARDADWAKLSELLEMDEAVVPAASKKAWSQQFMNAYKASPGLEPDMEEALTGRRPAAQTALAQAAVEYPDLKMTAAVDRTSVPKDGKFILTLTITAPLGSEYWPTFPAIDKLLAFRTGNKTNIAFADGKSVATVVQTYELRPQAVGKTVLPSIPLTVGGRTTRTAPIELTITGAAGPGKGERLANGALVEHMRVGNGDSPSASDKVRVNYEGRFEDGKVFESSYRRNQPVEFSLGGVIPCWTQGLQTMRAGGLATLTCPPDTAYGASGIPGTIPGGATLIFKVELLEVLRK